MRISFSGARNLRSPDLPVVRQVIANLAAAEFTSGAAIGLDTYAAKCVSEIHPGAVNRVVIPAAPHSALAREYATEVVEMPAAKTKADAYRARNAVLVDYAEPTLENVSGLLVAFPEGPEKRYPRSGTWMTIRMARKRNVPVAIFPLDCKEDW